MIFSDGNEATIDSLGPGGDFIGCECIANARPLRMATAVAMNRPCAVELEELGAPERHRGFVHPVADRACLCGICFTNNNVMQNRELAKPNSVNWEGILDMLDMV